MLTYRVIPSLLLDRTRLVKTRKFRDPQYVGDPINAIRIFNDKEVDELLVLDIGASRERRDPDYKLIEEFAGECFMPLAYGGGIRTVEQARILFSLGIEKLCIQSAALENPSILTELSGRFGSQSIVVSVDVKRSWLRKPRIFRSDCGKILNGEWLGQIAALVSAGAGELFLNSVDRDGTLAGPDLELIRLVSEAVNVPLIAAGGVASLSDIRAVVEAGANAVAAGAFFVFHGPHRAVLISYPTRKELVETFRGLGHAKPCDT